MTTPTITIHNIATDEIVTREMNAEELAQLEASKLKSAEEAALEAAKTAEKAALLTKLGISEDEAKLLLS
jgi:hypothetical protein